MRILPATSFSCHPDAARARDGWSRVHRLDYVGRFLRSRGPFTVPRSAQGTPVIIQAGQSGRRRRFAALGQLMLAYGHPEAAIDHLEALQPGLSAGAWVAQSTGASSD
jgi:alkanesulfonate monooxygenase SsuD/methylene tetrahydromethanopterin reductase-like flavin-dependent oxidoreductase (luciferase family)